MLISIDSSFEYEAVYHERVRRAGRLDFADVQRLLLPTERGLQAVPGLRVPKHRAPPQALQASSVWEYARRLA